MNATSTPKLPASDKSGGAATGIPVAQLVIEIYESAPPDTRSRMLAQLIGGVYETAPPVVRSRLLEHLLRPLGVLSLVTVARGVFAKFMFHSEWQGLHVKLEDVHDVQASDVVALADYVQLVSIETVNGLAQIISASPMMTASAAAAVLVAVLMKRSRTRREGDN